MEEALEVLGDDDRLEIDALQRNIKTNFQQIVSLSPLMSDDLQTLAMNIMSPDASRISSPRASARFHPRHDRRCSDARRSSGGSITGDDC